MTDKVVAGGKLNAIASYANFIITSLLVFFLNPYFIEFLGAYNFGIWKAAQKILNFATIGDGRSAQALKWVIANNAIDDTKSNKKAVGSAISVGLFFLPFLLVVLGTLVWSLPTLINNIELDSFKSIRLFGIILGANIVLSPVLKIPESILIGSNKAYRATFVQIIIFILSNIGILIISYLGFGLIGIALIILISGVINAIITFWVCKRNVEWLGFSMPSRDDFKKFFNFSFWVLLWSFIAQLLISSEILLISFLLGPLLVSKYVFSTYIIQLGFAISLISASAFTPGLGSLYGKKNYDSVKRLVLSLREYIFMICAIFASLIIIWNKTFVSLWMGPEYYLGFEANILMVLLMVQLILFRLDGQIQDVSLEIRKKVVVGSIFALVSILIAFLLYRFYENKIESILLGLFLGRICINFYYLKMVNKLTNLNSRMSQFVILLLIVIFSSILSYLDIEVSSWIIFFIYFGLTGIIISYVAFHFFITEGNTLIGTKLIDKWLWYKK